MSAWYVLSALGFYAVCPGDPNYLIGSPLFDKATLRLTSGKTFTITASHNGPQEFYIQSARLNGEPFDKTYISHEQIVNGGDLEFQMGSAPIIIGVFHRKADQPRRSKPSPKPSNKLRVMSINSRVP